MTSTNETTTVSHEQSETNHGEHTTRPPTTRERAAEALNDPTIVFVETGEHAVDWIARAVGRLDEAGLLADETGAAAERQRIAAWLLRLVGDPDTLRGWKSRHDLDSQYVGMALRALAADLTSGEPIPGLDDEASAAVSR